MIVKLIIPKYLLSLTLDKMSIAIFPAMSSYSSLRVKLFETFLISSNSSLAPDPLALKRKSWTLASEAVTLAFFTRFSIFSMSVWRAGARKAGTGLVQIAFVGGISAHYATRFKL